MKNKSIAIGCAIALDFIEIQGNATREELFEYLQLYPELGDITLCDILCTLLENGKVVPFTNLPGTFYCKAYS